MFSIIPIETIWLAPNSSPLSSKTLSAVSNVRSCILLTIDSYDIPGPSLIIFRINASEAGMEAEPRRMNTPPSLGPLLRR